MNNDILENSNIFHIIIILYVFQSSNIVILNFKIIFSFFKRNFTSKYCIKDVLFVLIKSIFVDLIFQILKTIISVSYITYLEKAVNDSIKVLRFKKPIFKKFYIFPGFRVEITHCNDQVSPILHAKDLALISYEKI